MINKQKLKEMNLKIWVIIFIALAIGLFLLKIIILKPVFAAKGTFLYALCNMFYSTLCIALWCALLYRVAQSKIYFYKTGRDLSKDIAQYGRSYKQLLQYFRAAEPHKLDISQFQYRSWRRTSGLVLGTAEQKLIALPTKSECNIAVFGPPGSGKTSGIAIPNALSFGGSVLAVDIKGDLYNYVTANSNRTIVRFCPDHPNALKESFHFDPFAGIEKMNITDKKLYLEAMATILIPEETGSDGYYFSSRARKMFQGIAQLLLDQNPETTFPELVQAILNGNPFDWVNTAKQSECLLAKEQIASFHGNNEKNISAVYDTLTTAMVHFSNPILKQLLTKSDRCISVDLLDQGCDIYLQISQEHLESYAPLFTLIIQSFCTAFMKRTDNSTGRDNEPVLMLMDEFPQLTFSYEMINSNLSTLRSKNVNCMIIQQNLSQLEQRYGAIGASSILGNCNVQGILGSNDMATSNMFSNMCGYKKILKVSNSETHSGEPTTGRTVSEASEKVFPPEYFGDLPSRKKLILYIKGKYVECKKINCYDQEEW